MSRYSMQTPTAPGRRAARPGATVLGAALFAAIWLVPAAIPGPALPQAHTVAGEPAGAETGTGPATTALPPPTDTLLRFIFLNVGQGDAVLIQAPEGQTALVDAGPRDVVPLLGQLGVEQIDLLVATHPHADHIGGMARVIESLPVRFYMDNGDPHTTQSYRRLIAALDSRPGITYLEAVPRTISLGSASIEVLPLLPRGAAGLNDRSVDRVEEGVAVLVRDAGERTAEVPLAGLPAGTREGSVLRVPETRGRPEWGAAVLDEELRLVRLSEAERILRWLKRRDPGGDVVL